MIPLRRNITGYRHHFHRHLDRGVREAAVTALSLLVIKTYCAFAFIPVAGLLAGYCIVHLAFKISAYYNIRIKPNNTLFYQTFQQYPMLKVIMLIYAVLVAGTYPYLTLALSILIGVEIGLELYSARQFDSKEWWLKKVWNSLLLA